MQKRYLIVIVVLIVVCLLVWQLSKSYAIIDSNYQGANIVTGSDWGVNIIEVSDINVVGQATITNNVRTIGTSLAFDVVLFSPFDEISFDILIENTGKFDAELYAINLFGLSQVASEIISYSLEPLDYLTLHEDNNDGSIIKQGEQQNFRVTVKYNNNIADDSVQEYNLNLGATITYRQK